MLKTYAFPRFEYRPSPGLRSGTVERHPVVVVGAGPVGLSAALDLARRGVPVVVLDDNDTVSVGSRALCYAKRTLEIWDRLGVADRMVGKGVQWKIGKVFRDEDLVYGFDLLPEDGHRMPAMINLQQYYLEEYLVEACVAAGVDLRWKHRVTGLERAADGVALDVETPDGAFRLHAAWTIACDGANSGLRRMVGADFAGQAFQDRFLIADVLMKAEFPTERWFWFDPPFHRGQSVLLHREADNVWRIDFQLGWDADPEEERKPERVIPRIRAMLGPEVEFDLEWVSVYQFACRRIDRFRHGRVLFAGDAAHQVSPFGARGANSGVQDVDNLGWKLALVLDGAAPESLLDSYHDERSLAADDNIANSTRSTDFITPKSRASRVLRDAVLELAEHEPFARRLVNSGRLSMPTPCPDSPLVTPDAEPFEGAMRPGTPCADAPLAHDGRRGWLLNRLGRGFAVLTFGPRPVAEVRSGAIAAPVLSVGDDVADVEGLLARRYDGRPGTTYLIRPDQHVAARWRAFDAAAVAAAIDRACGRPRSAA
ncbi:MAG TPA: FAD-dependent oxidoreductase [Burkholderiaceae bacterium]|nr:FAD-dependent oxidoreductase [Burkholderiaceae bacterium]